MLHKLWCGWRGLTCIYLVCRGWRTDVAEKRGHGMPCPYEDGELAERFAGFNRQDWPHFSGMRFLHGV